MDIRSFIKQLRLAADTLEALLQVQGTPEIASRIQKTLKRGPYNIKGKAKIGRPRKKLHWTQTPEGREKMRQYGLKRGKK